MNQITPEYLFQVYQTVTELVIENRVLKIQIVELQKKLKKTEKNDNVE